MPETIDQVKVFSSQSSDSKKKLVIGVVLLLALAGSFYGGIIYQANRTKITVNDLDKALPISSDILLNPAFNEFRATAEGTVSDKSSIDNTVTIKSNGSTVTVHVVKNLTDIYSVHGKGTSVITIDDIKIGDFARVEAWLPMRNTIPATGKAGDIVARSISVTSK